MKKIISLLLMIIVLIPINVFALDDINIYSEKYILYDATDDKVLLSKDIDSKSPIASLAKLMTVLVSVENIPNKDAKIIVKAEDLKQVPYDAYRLGLKADEEVTYNDLIYATIIASAGDTATVLAINTFGSIDKCVEAMNEKAKELGLTKTHFNDVIGLDDYKTYSTINDLLKLFKYVMNHDEVSSYLKTRYTIISGDRELSATYIGYSEIAKADLSSIFVGKAGYTDIAGLCFAFAFNEYGRTYYGITLNAPVENLKYYKNMQDAGTLINYIKTNYDYHTVLRAGDTYSKVKVINSSITEYEITVREDVNVVLGTKDDKNRIISKSTIPKELSPKYKKGDKIGTITYYYDGKVLGSVDVYLEEDIKFSLFGFFKSNPTTTLIIFLALFVITSIVTMLIIKKVKE